jgi:hypothetical protein
LKQDSRPNLVGAAMLRLLQAQGKECQRKGLLTVGFLQRNNAKKAGR